MSLLLMCRVWSLLQLIFKLLFVLQVHVTVCYFYWLLQLLQSWIQQDAMLIIIFVYNLI